MIEVKTRVHEKVDVIEVYTTVYLMGCIIHKHKEVFGRIYGLKASEFGKVSNNPGAVIRKVR